MRSKYYDAIGFVRVVSVKKLLNALKVMLSFYWSRWTGKPTHWGMPIAVAYEPTTACNLRCPECPSGLRSFTRPTGNLKHDFFRDSLDQISSYLFSLTFYFQGEPYINPKFLKMVKHAHDQGIYTVTSTNGHFLNDENCMNTIKSGLSRLIISIDGSTQEVYEQYRKSGDLEQVLEGARNMVKWKKALKSPYPYIIFQCLVVRPNENQIPEIYNLAEEIGVDEVKLKTAQLYDFENGNDLMPTHEKYSRYTLKNDGTYSVKHQLTDACWKMWHSCVITWDGQMVPCCFDKDASHPMGSLREHDFRTIWHGATTTAFRKKLLTGRSEIDICSNCSEGCSIWTSA